MRIDVRAASDDPEGADAAAARAGSATDDDGAVVAVLTAAGAGTRLGAGGPKALVEIGGRLGSGSSRARAHRVRPASPSG